MHVRTCSEVEGPGLLVIAWRDARACMLGSWSRTFHLEADQPAAFREGRGRSVDRVDGHQHDHDVFGGSKHVANSGGQQPFPQPLALLVVVAGQASEANSRYGDAIDQDGGPGRTVALLGLHRRGAESFCGGASSHASNSAAARSAVRRSCASARISRGCSTPASITKPQTGLPGSAAASHRGRSSCAVTRASVRCRARGSLRASRSRRRRSRTAAAQRCQLDIR